MLLDDRLNTIGFLNLLKNNYDKIANSPLRYPDYLNKSLTDLFESEAPKYPRQIRLPKSLPELLQGDFEPAKVITIDEPIRLEDGTPIWFDTTAKSIMLDFGYMNGDNRYLSIDCVGDKPVHSILAGTTGSGKSVTTNSILFNAMCRYAPWELKFHMSDAKIAEFKRYAISHHCPHIATIAATEDPGYTVSMLEKLYEEMQMWNSIYTLAGVQNIKDFRRATNLDVPRNLIVLDEFQFLFEKAGKKLKDIINLLSMVARAGRNSGYHLYLASQSLDSSLPDTILNNIGLRCCLRCSDKVSNRVLGNSAAKNISTHGVIYVTDDPESEDMLKNRMYRVPFQTKEDFDYYGTQLQNIGRKLGVESELDFYDQERTVYEDDYQETLKTLSRDSNKLFLGEPSFIPKEKSVYFPIKFDGEDVENVLVIGGTMNLLEKYALMFKYNSLNYTSPPNNLILMIDNKYERDCKLSDINRAHILDGNDFECPNFKFVFGIVPKLKLMIEADRLAFQNSHNNNAIKKILEETFGEGHDMVNELNISRGAYMLALLESSEEFRTYFKINTSVDIENENIRGLIVNCMSMINGYGLVNTRITKESLPAQTIWVMGMDKLYKIGRGLDRKCLELFKKILLDACYVNVKFYMFTRTMEDIDELRIGIRYIIFDGVNTVEYSRMKASDYPEGIPKVLGLLYDSMEKVFYKFKRISLNSEKITVKK